MTARTAREPPGPRANVGRVERPVQISYFSDSLCVWAYVAQIRVEELQASFGDKVKINSHFCRVFGNTETHIEKHWGHQGGVTAYGAHVQEVASRFEHVEVHPDVWSVVRPHSSMPCHLYLAAVRLASASQGGDPSILPRTMWAFRQAFFRDARDISDAHVRQEVAAGCGAPTGHVEHLIANGSAHAELATDLQMARDMDVRVSPTLVLNQGRQRLNGDVGYRIMEANVRELMERPQTAHSWC